jgi:hypothetical protein
MAAEVVQSYHDQKMAQERERVALRIANGTKASSSNVIGLRMQHPSYKGLPDNSCGSKNRPFFANKDESQIPLEEKVRMAGGVIRNYDVAKKLLSQTRDIGSINMAASAGLSGMPTPSMPDAPPVFSEQESKLFELNQLLQNISDAIGANAMSEVSLNEYKSLPRLVIGLIPTLSEQEIVRVIRFMQELLEDLENLQSTSGKRENTDSIIANADRASSILADTVLLLNDSLRNIGLDEKERRLRLKSVAKSIFTPGREEALKGIPARPGISSDVSVPITKGKVMRMEAPEGILRRKIIQVPVEGQFTAPEEKMGPAFPVSDVVVPRTNVAGDDQKIADVLKQKNKNEVINIMKRLGISTTDIPIRQGHNTLLKNDYVNKLKEEIKTNPRVKRSEVRKIFFPNP